MPKPAENALRSLGWQVISWIEHFCIHGPGDIAGAAAEIDDEFATFLLRCYLLNGRGRRLRSRAFLSRMKGRNKSGLAGWTACAESLGPVRFDHWATRGETLEIADWYYEFDEGEPVGRPVHSPEVLCFATEEGQAGNTYDVVYACMGGTKIKLAYPGVDAGVTRTNLPDGGTIEPVTSAASSKDGGKSTFVVFDETHLWYTAELRRTFATVQRNLGKRKQSHPWALETSTMYMPGQGSVAEDSHTYALEIAEGKRKDTTFLFDHVEGPADFDWNSNSELRAALKVAAGAAAPWTAFDDIIIKIRDPQAEEADSRRFWLNQVVPSTEQAVDLFVWATRARKKLIVEPGEKISLGFDGSRNKDATALLGCRLDDGLLFPIDIWERPAKPPKDWEISGADVDEKVRWAFATFDVGRMYGDPAWWGPYFDAWEAAFGKRVVRYFFSSDKKIALGQRQFVRDIASSALHTDDPRVNRHVANTRRRYLKIVDDESRKPLWVFAKENPNSPLCIDAATAAFLAWLARGDAIADGFMNEEGSSAAVFFDAVTWTCECGQLNATTWPTCRKCDTPQPELEPVG